MPKHHRRLSRSGTLSTAISDDEGTRTVELTYAVTIDLDSIVRQLAPLALLVQSSTKRTTRLNEAVELTVVEAESVEV